VRPSGPIVPSSANSSCWFSATWIGFFHCPHISLVSAAAGAKRSDLAERTGSEERPKPERVLPPSGVFVTPHSHHFLRGNPYSPGVMLLAACRPCARALLLPKDSREQSAVSKTVRAEKAPGKRTPLTPTGGKICSQEVACDVIPNWIKSSMNGLPCQMEEPFTESR